MTEGKALWAQIHELSPQNSHKQAGMVELACNPRAGKGEDGDSLEIAGQTSEKHCLEVTRVKKREAPEERLRGRPGASHC